MAKDITRYISDPGLDLDGTEILPEFCAIYNNRKFIFFRRLAPMPNGNDKPTTEVPGYDLDGGIVDENKRLEYGIEKINSQDDRKGIEDFLRINGLVGSGEEIKFW